MNQSTKRIGAALAFTLVLLALIFWMAPALSGVSGSSTDRLIARAGRPHHPTQDLLAALYYRLPDAVKDNSPIYIGRWDWVRSEALAELGHRTNESEVIVPALLDLLRSGRFTAGEAEALAWVVGSHPLCADQSIPVLLSLSTTYRTAPNTGVMPLAILGQNHPEVFTFFSNQLVEVFLGPSDWRTNPALIEPYLNRSGGLALSFSRLEGHEVARSNLLQRLLRETDSTNRAALGRYYRSFRLPENEHSWVLDLLSRDSNEAIRINALDGLAYFCDQWRNESNRGIVVRRLNEVLLDDIESPYVRATAAHATRWVSGGLKTLAPAMTDWLLTEDDFGGCGFEFIVDRLTTEGVLIPGFSERCQQAMLAPAAAVNQYCVAYWFCTLDTAGSLSRLAHYFDTTNGEEQRVAALKLSGILDWETNKEPSNLSPAGRATYWARRQAIADFLADEAQLAPFLNSLKTTLAKQRPDFRRFIGSSLYDFIARHEAATK